MTFPLASNVFVGRAYGPGELKILTSADGGNFEEALGWRSPAREEMAYTQIVMFETPRSVKALSLVMRSPRAWEYYGINDISLMVQPGASMLVSSSTTSAEETCLVLHGGILEGRNCLEAMARGSGEEIFTWNSKSQLVAVTGECLSLVGGGSRSLVLQDCEDAAEAGDGRSNFALSPSSRLKNKQDDCVAFSASGAVALPCASETTLKVVAVPEFDSAPAALLRDTAGLLRAAEARQRSLLNELKASMGACKQLIQMNLTSQAQPASSATKSKGLALVSVDPATEAAGMIDGAVDVNIAAVKALISESQSILASAS